MISRTKNSITNSKIGLFYSLLVFIVGFISRKVFLDHLGADLLGLNSTAVNLMNFINLAESGISVAIAYSLYSLLHKKNENAINEVISLQGWLFKKAAYIVVTVSIILMMFFPLIFANISVPMWYTYATFSVLLFSLLLSYVSNYKMVLLSANQQEFMITIKFNAVKNLIKVVFQVVAITYLSNGYVWWLLLEVIFSLLASYSINRTVKKEFPFLKINISRGKELSKKYPDVVTKLKQIFVHRIGGVVLLQSQPILVYSFTSLAIVAYYGNYLLIITGLNIIIAALFNGMTASVGNLVATGNRLRMLSVFEELFSLRFIITSTLCISTYYLTPDFITLWVGKSYILPTSTLILMITTFFITGLRKTVEDYIASMGLFQDTWAPIVEAILNISLSVILGLIYGLNGVLMGAILSLVIIILIWKPYFLFKYGFKISYLKYLKIFLAHTLVLGFIILLIWLNKLDTPLLMIENKYISFFVNSAIIGILTFLSLTILMWFVSQGTKDLIKRIISLLNKK